MSLLIYGLAFFAPEPARAADDGDETIQFEYAAPPECPAHDGIVDQVRSYTTRWRLALVAGSARRFTVRITRAGSLYTGRFDLFSSPDVVVGREIRGESCDDVVAGLAVAVALAIDPHALDVPAPPPDRLEEPIASPPPTMERGDPAARPFRRPAPAPVKPTSSATVSVGARADAHAAVSGILPTAVVFVELAWRGPGESARLFVLRPVLRGGVRQSLSRTAHIGASSADIGFRSAFVEVCPTRFALPARLSVEGCLGSNVGQLSAEAMNVSVASTQRRLWIDAGVMLDARWQAHRHLFVELAVGLWYPIIRDRIRIEPDGIVTQAPAIGPSVGVGGGWRF